MTVVGCRRCGQWRQHHAKGFCKNCYNTALKPGGDREKGRPGPDNDVDDVVVDRVVAGDLMPMTVAELTEVVRRLTAQGKSITEIARAVACTPRTVQRHRAKLKAS